MTLPLGGTYCTPITQHDGMGIGARIAFRDAGRPELLIGTIRELYLEEHPNVLHWRPDGFVFAEVELVDGSEARCWFERDKPSPASEIDGVLGAIPEGAMF